MKKENTMTKEEVIEKLKQLPDDCVCAVAMRDWKEELVEVELLAYEDGGSTKRTIVFRSR